MADPDRFLTEVHEDGGFDEIEVTFDQEDQSLHLFQGGDIVGLSKTQLRNLLPTLQRMEGYFR